MTFFRDSEGSALIEMALILPVFTALLVGVCSLGAVLQADIAFTDSARAGAEFALTAGNETNISQMQNVAIASAGSIPGYTATATNFCTCSPGSSVVSCSASCPGYGQPAMYAQVVATASIPLLFTTAATIPLTTVARVRLSCPSC